MSVLDSHASRVSPELRDLEEWLQFVLEGVERKRHSPSISPITISNSRSFNFVNLHLNFNIIHNANGLLS